MVECWRNLLPSARCEWQDGVRLSGCRNLTIDDGTGAGQTGNFKFNPTFTKLYLGGGINLLGATSNGSGNNAGEYTIVELTADRLVLHTGTNDAGTGWTWVFVPEE